MAHQSGRPKKTLFGKRAFKVEIKNLSDNEFEAAKEYLIRQWTAYFHKGAHLNIIGNCEVQESSE